MSMFLILPDGHDATYPVVDFLFKAYDSDGDGCIGHTELCAFLTDCGLMIDDLMKMDDDVQSITADSYTTEEFIHLLEKETLEVDKLHMGLTQGGVYGLLFHHLDKDGSNMLEPMEMFQFLKQAEIDINKLFQKQNKQDLRQANHKGYYENDFIKVMSRFDKEDLMKVVKFVEIRKADALTGLEWFENIWHIIDFLLSILIVICLCTEHEVEEISCTSAYHMLLTYAILKGVSYLFKSMVWACMGLTAGLGETQYIVAVCPLISWGLSGMAKHAVVVGASHEYYRQSSLGGDQGECWDQVHDKSQFFEIIFFIVIIRGLAIIAMLLIVWMLIPLIAIFIAGYAKGARHASEATVDGMSSIVAGLIDGNDVGNSKTFFGINGMLSALGVRSFVQGITTEDVIVAKRKQGISNTQSPRSHGDEEMPRSYTYPSNRANEEARKNKKVPGKAQKQLPVLLVDQISAKMGVDKTVGKVLMNMAEGFMDKMPTDMGYEQRIQAAADRVVDTCRTLAGDSDIAMIPSDPLESLRRNAKTMSNTISQLGDDAIGDEFKKLEKQLEAVLQKLQEQSPEKENDSRQLSLQRANTVQIHRDSSLRIQKQPPHSAPHSMRRSSTVHFEKGSAHSEEVQADINITERETHLYSEPRQSKMDTDREVEMIKVDMDALARADSSSNEIKPAETPQTRENTDSTDEFEHPSAL